MPYTPPNGTLAASWAGDGEYAAPKEILWGAWPADVRITPAGMRAPVLPDPTATIQQFAAPQGWFSGADPASPLVTYDWQYRPPFLSVHATWTGAGEYTLPPPFAVDAVWRRRAATSGLTIFADGFEAGEIGSLAARWDRTIHPEGWASDEAGTAIVRVPPLHVSWRGAAPYAPAQGVLWGRWAPLVSAAGLHIYPNPEAPPAAGVPHLVYPRALAPSGLDAAEVSGGTHIINVSRQIWADGLDAASVTRPLIWNLRQYAPILGWVAQQFGAAYVQGGVKTVDLGGRGLAAALHGNTSVINTTANQGANPVGIAPAPLAAPGVSPRTLWPSSIYGTVSGFPVVQFPPQPRGWQSSAFGYPSIRDKAHYARGEGFDAYVTGYAAVRDRAQKVLHQAAVVTSVFGDVAARLQNARVRPAGLDALETSSFAEVRSNRRYLQAAGVPTPAAGAADVRNKTPSLAPPGWSSAFFGPQHIGWRVRRINAVGVAAPLAQVALPSLWQTPGLRPAGIPTPAVAPPVVGLGRRTVSTAGRDALLSGVPTIGFKYRIVALEGQAKDSALYGAVRLEHGTRTLMVGGALRDGYGTPLMTFRVRRIEPSGAKPVEGGMRPTVGGTRWLRPDGYTATRWGTRIIPEAVTVFPLGFSGAFGWPTAKNVLQRVAPDSIRLYKEPQQHFGTNTVFSSRQFVSMEYDPDSGLNQPYWPRWTLVENRNRRTGASGWVASTLGTPHINNGARALLPAGASAPSMPSWYQAGLVAYRIRPLRLEGVEPPYVTGWLRIHNAARVVQPSGVFAQAFGIPAAENRSRALDRIGSGDFAWLGYPFVAPRIREITFEGRYTVGAPRIALPTVHLHQRYIDAAGISCPEVGRTSLEIRWNRVTPRWTMVNRYGYPAVKNLTPELLTRGSMTDEWGSALVRLEWRPVELEGHCTELFGRVAIADTRRTVSVSGTNALRIGDKLKVERTGAPPMALQYIWLNSTDPISMPNAGHGIPTPDVQVGKPSLQQQVLYPRGIAPEDLQLVGSPTVTANSIRVEPGIFELTVGDPGVSLRVRRVTAPSASTGLIGWGKPRITPHTIYAPLGAPNQATANHTGAGTPHPIDSIHRFGATKVENRHRVLTHLHGQYTNGGDSLSVGRAAVHNSKQYVAANGFTTMRFGWHAIPGDGELVVSGIPTAMAVGRPLVSRPPYVGPQTVAPKGAAPVLVPTKTAVEHFDRAVAAIGFAAGRLGGPKSNDKPFQWQGLRVGPLVPNVPEGFQSDIYGSARVSLRVRQVDVEGYDAFLCEYDYTAFEQRMRVRNSLSSEPATQRITTQGVDSSVCGWTQVRPMRHYIRPDGNSDQHRKGVIQ